MLGIRERLRALMWRNGGVREPVTTVPAVLPPDDHVDLVPDTPAEPFFGPAEGQSFMIEYVDAGGVASRRAVTVWSVIAGTGGIPCLYARCHARNAMRQFRVDRITCVIDLDGEVHDDVGGYLFDTLGIDPGVTQRALAHLDDWPRMRSRCRPFARLLAALSQSDGSMGSAEIEIAADYCLKLCERSGFRPELETQKALERYVKNLHPDERAVTEALDTLLEEPPDEIRRFLLASRALMQADGKIASAELALLNDISRELTGLESA